MSADRVVRGAPPPAGGAAAGDAGGGAEAGQPAPPPPPASEEAGQQPAQPQAGEEGQLAAADARESQVREPTAEPAADAEGSDESRAAVSQEDSASGASEQGDPELRALQERAAKADEYLELAQRTKADFENYRRRTLREAAAAQERGVAKLAKELLAAIDNLDRALAHAEAQAQGPGAETGAEEACTQLLSGIRLVHADLLAAFARVGIEPFSPVGETFDPQFHEAVAQQPFDGAEPGTVVEVYQLGYKLGEGVLRPARVLVAA
jgi:molecular chaperone GrpE